MKRRAVLAGISTLPFIAACGRGLGPAQSGSTNGHLIALDSDWKRRWQAEPGGSNMGMAAASGDRAFVQSGDGHFRAYDSDTGSELWSAETGPAGLVYSPPSVEQGLAFVVEHQQGSNRLLALSDASGRQAWEYVSSGQLPYSVVLASGNVVFPENRHGEGAVVALDASSGESRWEVPLTKGPGYIASDGERVFATSVNRELLAIDAAAGSMLWQRTVDDSVNGLAVTAGLLFMHEGVVSSVIRYRTRAYEPSTGQAIWEITVPDSAATIPSTPYPVAGHGQLYLFGEARQLLALEPATGKRIWEGPRPTRRGPWSGMIQTTPSAVLHANGIALDVLDPDSGRQLGRQMFPSLGQTILVSAQDDRVFVSSFGRSPPSRD